MKAYWDTGRWGLSSRIAALSLLLLLVVQGAVFSVVRISIEQSAHQQVQRELKVGERVWTNLMEQNAHNLQQAASLLASDYGFRSAVSTQDDATIRSVLDNHGARIGATVTALLDTQMALRFVGEGQDSAPLQAVLGRLGSSQARDAQSGILALIGQTPYQFVVVPMKAPLTIGWVVMGFPVGQKLLDSMRGISEMHLALLSQAPGQTGSHIVASTLPARSLAPLETRGSDVAEIVLDDDRLLAHSVAMHAGSTGTVHVILLRSVNEVMAPFRQSQVALAWITGLGVLLFGIGSVITARRVTTPLRALVKATEVLGQGRYDVPLEYTDRHDEIGGLATAFDAMRVNIGAQQAEIRELAYWDRLTGLPNRAQFRDALQSTLLSQVDSGRVGVHHVAVIMLDMDRFKHVNDVLGYHFGDQLLVAVAKRLSDQTARTGDLVARLGGDEFAVLLPGASAQDAHSVALRIAKSFEVPLAFDDQTVDMSAAMGIACFPEHAVEADALLSRAEVAMYAAKSRTTVIQVYQASLDSTSNETLSMLTELRQAIAHGELRLFLQPKIALDDQRVVAVEALVRWQHPQRGLVYPMDFIPFAEQTGFVRHLTDWVFQEAVRFSAACGDADPGFRIAINLSTRDLLDAEFPRRLDAVMAQHQVSAKAFCLEITESAMMDDPARAQSTLHDLSRRGFKLSIDDFGTGYSSLAYLKSLPVNELKIDRSFVMAMDKPGGDAKIVRSTIDLAHNLGLSVVAEGVESAAILEHLRVLHCDEAQGYFISKPIPASEFVAWRAGWSQRVAKTGIAA